MAQQTINVGTTANDGTGDVLRNAFIKTNDNFTELYTDRISGSGTDNYIPRFNGTNALENSIIFDSGTNVGIGTAFPSGNAGASRVLQVVGSFDTEIQSKGSGAWIRANSTNAYQGGFGGFQYYQNGVENFGIISNGAGTNTMLFTTGGSEKMRITSAGNVGIGTSSPAYPLEVNGSINVYPNNFFRYDGDTGIIGSATSIGGASNQLGIRASNDILFATNGANERMRITSAGKVGIGTTSPPYKFSVYDTSDGVVGHFGGGVSNYTLISFRSNEANVYSTSLGSYNSGMLFRTGASDRMYINSSGNVGIGTTTANYRTQIETTGADVFLTKNTSSSSYNRSYFYNNNNIGIQLSNFGSAYPFGTEYGVGPNGSIIQSNTTSMFAIGTSGAYPLVLGTNGTERMRIISGGNVGIGTSSPNQLLSISSPSIGGATFGLYNTYSYVNNRNWALKLNSTNYGDLGFMVSASNGGNPETGIIALTLNINGNIISLPTYNNGSGGAANVGIASSGELYRSTSSLKYKKNIENYSKGLNEIMQMRPVTYNSINEKEDGILYAGLIAEEIHELGMNEFVQYAQDGTPDALSYANMVSLLVKGIQELKEEIEILKSK